MDALVLIGSFVLLMVIGLPVAYSLGLAALVGALWIDLPLDAVMIQIGSGVNKFSLLAIPFFVLAGAIMAEGGMARRLVAFAGVLVGFIRGGLSLVNIMASTFFGAISGSSVADTASIGSVLIPEMEKKGYPRPFATAVTVSGSVQAILIPPSHNAVLYSLAAGGSISIEASSEIAFTSSSFQFISSRTMFVADDSSSSFDVSSQNISLTSFGNDSDSISLKS